MDFELEDKNIQISDQKHYQMNSTKEQAVIASNLLKKSEEIEKNLKRNQKCFESPYSNYFINQRITSSKTLEDHFKRIQSTLKKIKNRKIPFLVFGYDKRNQELSNIDTHFSVLENCLIKKKGGTRKRRRRSRRS
jgi:hypothetical protein